MGERCRQIRPRRTRIVGRFTSPRRPNRQGGAAAFESEVTFTEATSFQEIDMLTFGNGYLGACANPACKHGTAVWRVEEGEGQFAGASGLITSNFFVGVDGEVTDHHLGVILLR